MSEQKKNQTIWVSTCDDVFGGYGLTATGWTRKAAEGALWAEYVKTSPQWNKADKPFHKSFKSLADWHGIHTRKLEVGKGYFGDNEIGDIPEHKKMAKGE